MLCFQGRRTLVVLVLPQRAGGTSAALIPPTLVDSGTGGRRLRVSDTNRLKFRYIRLGRMSVCVRKCRRIRSQLHKSDARPVRYRPTKPDHLRFRWKRRRRSCCPVLLCSSPSTRDVGVVTFSPNMKMGYCSSPIQRDEYSVVISSWRLLVFCLEPYRTRMLSGCNRHKHVRLSTLVDRTL